MSRLPSSLPNTPLGPKALAQPSRGDTEADEYYEGTLDILQNTWLFELPDVLHTTPSRFQGVELSQEMILRHKAALFIQRMFAELKLSHRTLFTAWTYLHRFYMRGSLKIFGQYEVAAACVFLACKCTENHRSYKDLIPVVVKDTSKGKVVECKEGSKEFWKWRDVIEIFECNLLELLCFDLLVDLPYGYTQTIARTREFQQICGDDRAKLDRIMGKITLFIEDSALVGMVLVHPVEVIFVTACVYTAMRLSVPGNLMVSALRQQQMEIKAENIHDCLVSLATLAKTLPPEYAKRFADYKEITTEELQRFISG